jgi:hypothetical protein
MADNPLHPQVTQPGPMAKGGNKSSIDPGFMGRVKSGLSRLFSGGGGGSSSAKTTIMPTQEPDDANGAWMGPGRPMRPVVNNPWDVAGRGDDYPVGYNIGTQPRRMEGGPSFEELEALAENLDMLALAIATREDQMGNLTGSWKIRKAPGQSLRPKPDQRCADLDDFFRRPDGRQGFRTWLRELVHEQLVYDAPAIYVRRTIGGDVYRLEVVKGKTIQPKIDITGRMPDPPNVAYQQILKGVPAINYTSEELIYWPRNRRTGRRYGYSPVQQVIMTVNIAIRREVAKFSYFTEGNIPEALCSVPEGWTPDQIERFQVIFDALQADQRTKSKLKFVPGGMNFQQTRSDSALMGAVDEWLARVICYAFSLPPLPFVQQMNRATADTSNDAALSEGLQPMMLWAKDLLDHIGQRSFGYDDIEWVWDEIDDVDPAEQQVRDIELVKAGLKSIDQCLIERGEDPIGMSHAIFGIGPLGVMFIDDLLKAKAQGLTMPQPPPPPDMMGGMGGAPGFGGQPPLQAGPPGAMPVAAPIAGAVNPAAAAALSSIHPSILDAVGLGRGGPAGRKIDVTAADAHKSDPMSNVVFHPQVLATLRDAERRQGRSAAR